MRRALMLPSPNSGVRQALSQLYQCHRIGSPAECPLPQPSAATKAWGTNTSVRSRERPKAAG